MCMMCTYDSEEREDGVGAGVNGTILSETLVVISLSESAARAFGLRKKPMNLCACNSEERGMGFGTSLFVVNFKKTKKEKKRKAVERSLLRKRRDGLGVHDEG